MSILVTAATVLAVVAAFFLGFFVGLNERTPKGPLLPVEAVQPDAIKQRQFEEEQKAFSDCMNYSIDVAYGGK